MLKIDILITHKDRIEALSELLTTLYSQKGIENFNIIVLDDDSKQTDKLPRNCLKEKCGSSAKAKRTIIKRSFSEYFMIIDSDDLPTHNFCESVLNNFEEGFDVTSFLFLLEKDMKVPSKYLEEYTPKNIVDNCLLRYPAIIKRKTYNEIGGIDFTLKTCADVDLYWRLYLNNPSLCRKVMTPILIKRQLDKSISVSNFTQQQTTFLRLKNKYLKGI